jgi:hypothetical protein
MQAMTVAGEMRAMLFTVNSFRIAGLVFEFVVRGAFAGVVLLEARVAADAVMRGPRPRVPERVPGRV